LDIQQVLSLNLQVGQQMETVQYQLDMLLEKILKVLEQSP
jgi:hypothetical protein